MDDIDHVHDSTSSEDLKLMVAQWEAAQSIAPKSARDSVRPQSWPSPKGTLTTRRALCTQREGASDRSAGVIPELTWTWGRGGEEL